MAKKRILIADDEEGIRESLGLIFSQDYDLSFAKDGEQALSMLKEGPFDLVLLDIKMPRLDGLEVLKKLSDSGIKIPVLMLSAYQSVDLAREAVKLGARDYLLKPFEREQIISALRSILV